MLTAGVMTLCGSAVVEALSAYSVLSAGDRNTSHAGLLRRAEQVGPVIKDPPRINL